ncbi:MAG: hypothetical protein ACRC35_04035 [Angustibacter sp.]
MRTLTDLTDPIAAALAHARAASGPGQPPDRLAAIDPRPPWSADGTSAAAASSMSVSADGELTDVLRESLACLPGRPWLRPTASAGGRHPVDVVIGHGATWSTYDPVHRRLVPVAVQVIEQGSVGPKTVAQQATAQQAIAQQSVAREVTERESAGSGRGRVGDQVVIVGVTPDRTVAKYGARSLPSLLLDAGHAVAAIAAAAQRRGRQPRWSATAPAVPSSLSTGRRGRAAWYPLAAVRWSAPASEADRAGDGRDTVDLARTRGSAATPASALRAPARAVAEEAAVAEAEAAEVIPGKAIPGKAMPGEVGPGATAVVEALRHLSDDPTAPRWTPVPPHIDPGSGWRRRRSAALPWTAQRPPTEQERSHLVAGLAHPVWWVLAGPSGPVVVDHRGRRYAGDARPVLAGWACGQGWLVDVPALVLWTASGSAADGGWDTLGTGRETSLGTGRETSLGTGRETSQGTGIQARDVYLGSGFAAQVVLLRAAGAGLHARAVGCWTAHDLGACVGLPEGRHAVVHAVAVGR